LDDATITALVDREEFLWLLALGRLSNAIWDPISRVANWPENPASAPEAQHQVYSDFFLVNAFVFESRAVAEELERRFQSTPYFSEGFGSLLGDSSLDDLWKPSGSQGVLADMRNKGVFHFTDIQWMKTGILRLPASYEKTLLWVPSARYKRGAKYYPLADLAVVANAAGLEATDDSERALQKLDTLFKRTADLGQRVLNAIDTLMQGISKDKLRLNLSPVDPPA